MTNSFDEFRLEQDIKYTLKSLFSDIHDFLKEGINVYYENIRIKELHINMFDITIYFYDKQLNTKHIINFANIKTIEQLREFTSKFGYMKRFY